MKKQFFTLILLFIISIQSFFSQEKKKTSGFLDAKNFNPVENIYIHFNSSVLFSGEYLYYKVYCINSSYSPLSELSKIAYVELISSDRKNVFKHKIKLFQGEGQGDFFIPTNISSGAYKLIAYTQWMKNGGKNYFFQEDINILNPYKGNQGKIVDYDSAATVNKVVQKENKNSGLLSISTNKKVYKKREKINITINNSKYDKGSGNYSISIRKKDAFQKQEKLSSINFKTIYKKTKSTTVYYPELNGEIISGKVIIKNSNLPAIKKNVALSIPGKNFIFRVATTDELGIFEVSIPVGYDNEKAIIQVLGEDRNNYQLELIEQESVDYSKLKFNSFSITPQMKEEIIKRSVYNQIENAYYSVKPDTVTTIKSYKPFYDKYNKTNFVLDDYTRFSTLDETFVEVIEHAWSDKNEKGENTIYVRNNKDSNKNFLPLVFIDGVLIQDHQHLFEYSAEKVEMISILRGEAHFGTKTYQGVVIIQTKEENYKNKLSGDFLLETKLFKPQQDKKYFHQTYTFQNREQTSRIPDFRDQLLWEPKIDFSSETMVLSCFTSDNTGIYEISVEGFTLDGMPVSIYKTIEVEN